MHKNKIYVRTAKAERKAAKLSADMKRMLSLMDGKSTSGELAKHAPPSLRKIWNELLNELVEGGYISDKPEAIPDRKSPPRELNPKGTSDPKPVSAAPAIEEGHRNNSAISQDSAELFKQMEQEVRRARAGQNAAAAEVQVTSDTGAKAEVEAKQKAEKSARTRELKAFFAAAKEKAKAEAKQAQLDAARARAEHEAAIPAAKVSADAGTNAKAKVKVEAKQDADAGLHAKDVARLRDLEMENEWLKKQLAKASQEITSLKASFGVKR